MTPLLNLLPWRALQRQRRLRFRIGITGLVTLLLVSGFWGGARVLSERVIALQRQGAELESQHHRLQETMGYQQEPQQGSELLSQRRIAEKERLHRVSRWGSILTTLASTLPESSWLRTINWQADAMTLEGYTAEMDDLEKIDVLLTQLSGRFHVKAGPVSYQAAQGLNYTFILEENGDALVLP